MTQNILIHSLRYSDIIYVHSDGKYKENMFSQFWNGLYSINPDLTFQKVILQLLFNKAMIHRIIRTEIKYGLSKFNLEIALPIPQLIQLVEFKNKIYKRFKSDFNIEVEIYGPDTNELDKLENFIKFYPNNETTDIKSVNKYIFYGLSNKSENLEITNIKDVKGKLWDLNYYWVTWENINVIHNGIDYKKSSFLDYPSYNDFFSSKSELARQIEIEQLRLRLSSITKILDETPKEFNNIITENDEMLNIIRIAKHYSSYDENILITGETGTGKDLFAEAIHNASERSKKANSYITVNCAAIPKELAESELFGHSKGAFTGAINDKKGYLLLADKGTLFLDEIGELEIGIQAKLLRAIEKKEFYRFGDDKITKSDFRLICATNKDIENGDYFREDLFSRISTLTIEILPLKERGKDDIKKLSEYFLEIILKNNNKFYLTSDAQNLICSHDWPLNVRQLKYFITKVIYNIDFHLKTGEKNVENDESILIGVDDIEEILKREKTKSEYNSNINDNFDKKEDVNSESENNELFKVDINKVGNIDNFFIKIEKAYLEAAMKKNLDQKVIAKLFGYTNQSMVSSRMKSVGLNYKVEKRKGRS